MMNLGSERDFSVREYYEIVSSVVEFNGSFVNNISKPDGMPKKLMDSSTARSLGWKPETEIKYGLRKTYEWFLKEYRLD